MSKKHRKNRRVTSTKKGNYVAQRLMGIFLLCLITVILGLMAVNFFKTHHDTSQVSIANNKKPNTSQQTSQKSKTQSENISQPKYRFYDELKKRNAEVQKELQQKMQEEPKTSNIKGRNYRIQIGAFSEKESADRIRARMILRDYPVEIINNGKLYLVQIGPYVDRAEAVKVQKRIEREGIRETVLKAYVN